MSTTKENLEYMGISTECNVGDQFIYNHQQFVDLIYTCSEKRPVWNDGKITHHEYYFEPSPNEYIYDGIRYPYLTVNMRIEFLWDFLLRRIWIRKPNN